MKREPTIEEIELAEKRLGTEKARLIAISSFTLSIIFFIWVLIK